MKETESTTAVITREAMGLLDKGMAANANSKDAIAIVQRAIELFEEISDNIGLAKGHIALAALYNNNGNISAALEWLEKAVARYRQASDTVGMSVALLNLSACFYTTGDYAKSLYHVQESIRLLTNAVHSMKGKKVIGRYVYGNEGWFISPDRNYEYLAHAYVNCGNTLRFMGEMEKAIEAYQQAKEAADNSPNLSCRAMTYNQLGDVLLETGSYTEALDAFQTAYELFIQSGKKGYVFAVVCQGIGEAYAAAERLSEAKDYFDIALAEFRSIQNVIGQIDVHYHFAELHGKQQHWKSALKLYEKALQMAQSISAAEHVVRTMRGVGKATANINAKNALSYLTQALLLAEEHGLKKEQMQIHKELSVYYKMYRNPALALFHLEKYHAVRDFLTSEKTQRQLNNLKILHEVETYKGQIAEKERRLALLEQELDSKTRELDALALSIIEKRDFMEMVANGLKKIIGAQPSEKDYFARTLLESLDIENTTKKAWQEFADQFMSVHRSFIEKLLHLCPSLTPTELRVCVLLRMSLNSKHIAEILHLSLRSVENHRLHIRKKLLLDDKINLSGYIISLE